MEDAAKPLIQKPFPRIPTTIPMVLLIGYLTTALPIYSIVKMGVASLTLKPQIITQLLAASGKQLLIVHVMPKV